jgi:hypothetical protein
MKIMAIHDKKGRIKSVGVSRAGRGITFELLPKRGELLATFDASEAEFGSTEEIMALASRRIRTAMKQSKIRPGTQTRQSKRALVSS